jgi:hypothetical protein
MHKKRGAICIVDTFPQKAFVRLAIDQMLRHFEPQNVYIFSDEILLDGAKHYRTPVIMGMEGYNRILLTEVPKIIEEDFVIIFQWDGFALNRENFHEDFLLYDYIGAPWPSAPVGLDVGNGGFSLRSRRLLDCMLALHDHLMSSAIANQPEDLRICVHYRNAFETMGVKFAPLNVAKRFSFEWVLAAETFGFHGVFNFPFLLHRDALEQHMPEVVSRVGNPQLIRALNQNIDKMNQYRPVWS